jgi:hypothetical protein
MRRAVLITIIIVVGIVAVFAFLRSRTAVSNQQVISVGVKFGATQIDAVQHLEQIGATILTNTPELLWAQFKTPGMAKPWQVELGFRVGKLDSVLYIPPEVYLRSSSSRPNTAPEPMPTAP